MQGWDVGFWSQCHLLIKRWRHLQKLFFAKVDTPPHLKLGLGFLESLSLADQKAETTPYMHCRDLGFLDLVSVAN